MPPDDIEVLARLLRAIEPYLNDVVLIGGWVHALYLQELDPAPRSVRTTDVDLSIPRRLSANDRPPLLELVEEAGFEVEQIAGDTGLVLIRSGDVDLDILCDAESPSEIIPIEGQVGLSVQGYPYLDMLLDSSHPVTAGAKLHRSFEPPITLRIPTLPAYVLGKVLSAQGRTINRRRIKDLVYLYQTLTQRRLRTALTDGLQEHVREYPAAADAAVDALANLMEQTIVLRGAAEQLYELGTLPPGQEALASLKAQMRRLQTEVADLRSGV